MNQDINNARLIGYLQGTLTSYAERVRDENCLFTREEIAEGMEKASELAEKWFSVRYEGPFMPEDIRAMIKRDRSDIVELERASDIVELERA